MKLLTLISFVSLIYELNCEESLVFVQAIFRHGNRTPEKSNLYQSSPYMNETFFKPYGFGQLTNKGKLTAYNFGKALRNRYNGFLDEEYNIKLIDARSSDFNRNKASLQAMLAGLFPPTKDLVWLEGLKWQPIAYTYKERSLDKELFCFTCPNWYVNFNDYVKGEEGKSLLNQHKDTLEYLTEKTGHDYNELLEVYYLYIGFEILSELGYSLPDWASSVYPHPMKNITTICYKMMVATQKLKQLAAGFLLKKLLSDVQEKINGKIPEKKMSLWCGHEHNIAALLLLLNESTSTEVPSYGSYILMELHFINQTYGLKIYHSNEQSDPVLVTVPGCDKFCPLDRFHSLMKENIPESDKICGKDSASSLFGSKWIIFTIQLLIVCSNILS